MGHASECRALRLQLGLQCLCSSDDRRLVEHWGPFEQSDFVGMEAELFLDLLVFELGGEDKEPLPQHRPQRGCGLS